MAPTFDNRYLNRTANKTARGAGQTIEFVVWHETASPSPDNPLGTLEYNLSSAVQSSYNFLVARDGTIFHYVDERSWITWHAGVSSSARGYEGWLVNVHSIGVEVDGPNNGTPITPKQRDAITALILFFRDALGIPIDRAHHLGHKEVAPGYKSDPQAYSVDRIVELAQSAAARDLDPQVLGLSVLECDEGMWLRSLARNKAAERGLSEAAQRWLYGQCRRLGVEPWLILAMMQIETGFGRTAAGPAGNWLNIKEYSEDRPGVIVDGRRFESHGTPELGIERGILHLADAYGYGFKAQRLSEVVARWANAVENDVALYIRKCLGNRQYILAN